ncbi:DNA replication protein DnaD [Vulcanisaeta thermophila]|uniref:DNA replication protein DnaD n=1 Tax=Vulcanisaeta thermophila TaxID=867917 RepID=UPI000852ED1E|nr:DNA replication protein DnaD [Vulcanisaeta thermophila]
MAVYLVLDEQTGLLIFLFFIILLAWKPETLPVIARELGRWYREARRVIDGFTRELMQYNSEIRGSINSSISDVRAQVRQALTLDPDIVRIAKTLGISTEGKTKEELVSEILKRLGEFNNKQG